MPGLKVIMPAFAEDAKGMIAAAVEDDNPVVVIEHRWSHYTTSPVAEGYVHRPLDGPRTVREGDGLTIVATSYMTLEAVRAADKLAEAGYPVEVLDLRVIRPLNLDPIVESVARTGRLMPDAELTRAGQGLLSGRRQDRPHRSRNDGTGRRQDLRHRREHSGRP